MINYAHSLLHRPQKGWDPIPPAHAKWYAEAVWKAWSVESPLLDLVDSRIGGLQGKRVLDLGGGPGQFSVAMAKRGASVTWHDVSRQYMTVASEHARDAGVAIEFSLGYLEDAVRFHDAPFDLVFCLLCWCYSMDDRGFGKLLYGLTKPGGACHVEANNSTFERASGLRRWIYFMNRVFWFKVGHPHPPKGRIASLLGSYPVDTLIADYTYPAVDRVFFVRSRSADR